MLRTASRFVLPFLAAASIAGCSGGHAPSSLPPPVPVSGGPAATVAVARTTAAIIAYDSAVLADAPLAYYTLADRGTTLADSSGKSLNGTYGGRVTQGVSTIVPGDPRSASAFPGGSWSSTAVAAVPANKTLAPTAGVTIETWIRPGVANQTSPIISYGNNNGRQPYQPYWLHLDNGQVNFGVAVTNADGWWFVQSATVLQTNATYHIVATFDGRYERMYVNGKLDGTYDNQGTYAIGNYDATNGLTIGADTVNTNGSTVFRGTLQDVAIYAGALSAARVTAHYSAGTTYVAPPPSPTPTPPATPAPSGGYSAGIAGDKPLAYYPLGDGTSVLTDASGNAHNGTYGSAVKLGTAGIVLGDAGTAASFAGGAWQASRIATVPASNGLAPKTAVSLEAWIKPATANATSAVLSYGNNNVPRPYQPYWLHLEEGQVDFGVAANGGGWWFAQSKTVLAANQVYHVVATFDGRYDRIYINGNLDSTYDNGGTYTIGNYDATSGLTFGADTVQNASALFSGTLQDVGIYGYAVSAATVSAHYKLGITAIAPAPVVATPTPVPTTAPTRTPTPATPAPTAAPTAAAVLPASGTVLSHIHTFTEQSDYGDNPLLVSGFNWSQVANLVDIVEDINNNNTIAAQAPSIERAVYSDPVGTCWTPGFCADRPAVTAYNKSTDFLQCANGAGAMLTPYSPNTLLAQGDPTSANFVNVSKQWEQSYQASGAGTTYFHMDDMMFPEQLNGFMSTTCAADKNSAPSTWRFGNGAPYSDTAYLNGMKSFLGQMVRPILVEGPCNGDGSTDTLASGLNTDPSSQWRFAEAPNAAGAFCEKYAARWGAPPYYDDDTKLQVDLNTQLALHSLGKKFIAWTYLDTGVSKQDAIGDVLATLFLAYDPNYDYLICRGCAGNSKLQLHTAELFVPTQPLQSASWPAAKIGSLKQNGLYVREFAACYMAGSLVGRCAAVVNPDSSSHTLPTLRQSYAHRMTISGLGIQTGNYGTRNYGDDGAVQFTAAMTSTVGGQGWEILIQ